MSERKKHTNRLLVFMGLLFLLSFLPWNTLNAKAAVTLSRKKMILTVNQKQYLRVKGRPAGSTLIWRSSNTSVATVAGGTVRARRRGIEDGWLSVPAVSVWRRSRPWLLLLVSLVKHRSILRELLFWLTEREACS